MKNQYSPAGRIYLSLMAIAGWFALITQFYLFTMINKQLPVTGIITRYFTFYTILTNLLVAAGCTFLLLKPVSGPGKFFSRATTLTAIAVNITIVGAVYNIILRFLWKPQGLQYVVDELLHLIIPVAYIVFWVIFVPKGTLKWNSIFLWLIYPLAYLAVILIQGALSGYYPYPFVDVNKLGYPKTLLNSAGIAAAFIVVALIFVTIDKLTGKKAVLERPA
jgi:hypothetical protein